MIKFDYEKIKQSTGLDFTQQQDKETDLIYYIQSVLYNLKTHNKNYTKEQYNRIDTLFEIFESVK